MMERQRFNSQRMGEELFSNIMRTESFIRVQDSTGSPLPEDDLFAGLRPQR